MMTEYLWMVILGAICCFALAFVLGKCRLFKDGIFIREAVLVHHTARTHHTFSIHTVILTVQEPSACAYFGAQWWEPK